MIKVDFRKPAPCDAFDAWVKRCTAAAQKLTSARGIKAALYKEQRQAILDAFHKKCAYCEAKIVLDQHNGDLDHFRPKGRVTDENDRVIEIEDGRGRKVEHPGYFWLAYSWMNLLPSCIACNRPNKVGTERVGKWERFPVTGKHARTAQELGQELPLLLNPLNDDPAQHLEFDPDTGRIIGKTDRGRMTEFVLKLNRDGLPEARRNVYDMVRAKARDAFEAEMNKDYGKLDRHLEFLIQHKRGEAAYSMAGRPAVDLYRAALNSQAKRLSGD